MLRSKQREACSLVQIVWLFLTFSTSLFSFILRQQQLATSRSCHHQQDQAQIKLFRMQDRPRPRIQPTEADSPQPQQLGAILASWLRHHRASLAAMQLDTTPNTNINSNIIHNSTSPRNSTDEAITPHHPDEEAREPSLPPWVFLDLNSLSVTSASSSSTPAPMAEQGSSSASAATAATTMTSTAAAMATGEDREPTIASTAPPDYASDVERMLIPQLEGLSTAEDATQSVTTTPPPQEYSRSEQQAQERQQQQLQQSLQQSLRPHTSGPSASARRLQSKYKQPWRRTQAEVVPRKSVTRRMLSIQELGDADPSSDIEQASPTITPSSSSITSPTAVTARRFDLPHDILLVIFSYLPSRANVQQYYARTHPSDLVACSRVNMAWRIAALSTMWHTILLPDPLDRSCRRLLHLLASSHASAQITGKNYDITEIIQRVEIDLLEATELLLEDKDLDTADEAGTNPSIAVTAEGATTPTATTALMTATFGTARPTPAMGPPLSLPLPPPPPSLPPPSSSSSTTTPTSDMAAMTDHITTLLQFVSPFRTLSIQLPQEIESNAAEILTRTASLPILDAIVQGIQEAKIQELDMPSPMYCSVSTFPGMLNLITNMRELRTLILGYSSRDWPLLQAIISLPNLENLCVFDSCWSNQIWIYLLGSLGPRLRGLTVLQGRRPLEGVVLREGIAPYCRNLTTLSIPFIQLLQGPNPVLTDADVIPVLKACKELQSINLAGQRLLGNPVLEAMTDLWGLQMLDIRDCHLMTGQSIKSVLWQSIQRVRLFGCGELSQEFMDLILQAWRGHTAAGTNHSMAAVRHFASVLDFGADVEDPVEMGWVRQREDEPPLDLNEDHFFCRLVCMRDFTHHLFLFHSLSQQTIRIFIKTIPDRLNEWPIYL